MLKHEKLMPVGLDVDQSHPGEAGPELVKPENRAGGEQTPLFTFRSCSSIHTLFFVLLTKKNIKIAVKKISSLMRLTQATALVLEWRSPT